MGTLFVCRPNATFSTSIDTQWPDDDQAHYLKVDDVTPDENSTYVRAYLTKYNWQKDSYGFEYSALPASAIINSVSVYGRFKGGGADNKVRLHLVNTSYSFAYGSQLSPASSWDDYSYSWAVNPFTSSAWQYSDLSTLRFGVGLYSTDLGFAYCTQAWIVIDAIILIGGGSQIIGLELL